MFEVDWELRESLFLYKDENNLLNRTAKKERIDKVSCLYGTQIFSLCAKAEKDSSHLIIDEI
jgi:hypothetical protein